MVVVAAQHSTVDYVVYSVAQKLRPVAGAGAGAGAGGARPPPPARNFQI